jgi:DNA-binding transcriptional MerR regulator
VSPSAPFLNASEAAKRLGVSPKALRLYEQRGLVIPVRTSAGWRTYGPTEMARAGEIVALRALGLSLAQVARVLRGAPQSVEPALAAHQAMLERQIRQLADTVEKIRALRTSLVCGEAPVAGELVRLVRPTAEIVVAFDLPWPCGGERFELCDIRQINYIIGPLGSGKTRLAQALAKHLPGGTFLGLERLESDHVQALVRTMDDAAVKSGVDQTLAWLVEDGATASTALTALVTALESDTSAYMVVDMVEQGLDQPSQEALMAHLRHRSSTARPLFLMTRSSAILDLSAVGSDETIILCPANHSPPVQVAPYPGAPGYEAVATCLASPDVRARTAGVVAWRPSDGNNRAVAKI